MMDDFLSVPNLNWLIHIAYARGDFNYCKDVICHQFRVTYDHEFLYFVKVNIAESETSQCQTRIPIHWQGLIARDEGNLQESLQSLQRAIDLNPENLENLKEIGKTL